MKKTIIITLATVVIIAGYMFISPADDVKEPTKKGDDTSLSSNLTLSCGAPFSSDKYFLYGAIALVLYVLSLGPAWRLNVHGYLSDEIGIIYMPIFYLAENATFLQEPIVWYLELWVPSQSIGDPFGP